jgi:hypothetical protein
MTHSKKIQELEVEHSLLILKEIKNRLKEVHNSEIFSQSFWENEYDQNEFISGIDTAIKELKQSENLFKGGK